MKLKRFLIVLFLVVFVCFSSCVDDSFRFREKQLKKEVVRIEILYITEDGDIQFLDEVQEENKAVFLEKFSSFDFKKEVKAALLEEQRGYAVKLIRSNNSFYLATLDGVAIYDASETFICYKAGELMHYFESFYELIFDLLAKQNQTRTVNIE